ncbi:hypothetical protein QQF64_013715 [Cirrhinus molitorella]|uniref:TRIM8/14/16/25/29/45/65 coiled-coil region domain-containing protein n=1 Tax=Cirrhinus molitorella TaxID=172907 RepID=A0ABR3LV80_9TELE
MVDEHKDHETVSTAAERTVQQKQLDETQTEFQQQIQEREKKLQELKEAVESHKRSAQTAVEDSECLFTELISSIERRRSEVTQMIRNREKTIVSQAKGLMERLKQEIDQLRRSDAELKKLSQTHNHTHFLQSLSSLPVPPGSPDVPSITDSSLDVVGKSVSKMRQKLEDFCKEKIEKLSGRVTCIQIIPTPEYESRKDFLQSERTEKQRQLDETISEFQQQIQEREKKLQELKEAVESHKCSAQTAVENSERIFTELISSIERRRSEVTQMIRDREKTVVSQAEGLLEQLEQEINDLSRRNAELELLSNTLDHIHFLQSFPSLSAAPGSPDIPRITFSSYDDVGQSVFQLRHKLEYFCKRGIEEISGRVAAARPEAENAGFILTPRMKYAHRRAKTLHGSRRKIIRELSQQKDPEVKNEELSQKIEDFFKVTDTSE